MNNLKKEQVAEVVAHLESAEGRVKLAMTILLEYDYFKAVEHLAVGVQVITEMQEELQKLIA